jgi:hypothetical protein
MISSDKFFTIVFKDLTSDERVALWNAYSDKISASSYSHATDDRDQSLEVLCYAECALGDIGDADREPGDDLEWCERRAAEALPLIRKLLLAHGKTTTTLTTMTNQQHPITSTDEMVRKWIEDWAGGQMKGPVSEDQRVVATQAAQWGWDQRGAVNEAELQKARDEELEACCEWVRSMFSGHPTWADELRAARRPKPPTLKEQALEVFEALIHGDASGLDVGVIRRALETLPNG